MSENHSNVTKNIDVFIYRLRLLIHRPWFFVNITKIKIALISHKYFCYSNARLFGLKCDFLWKNVVSKIFHRFLVFPPSKNHWHVLIFSSMMREKQDFLLTNFILHTDLSQKTPITMSVSNYYILFSRAILSNVWHVL